MRYLIYLMLCVVVSFSCKRRPLTYEYYPYADLTIEIDWSEAFEEEDKPTGVSVWFYPQDGSAPLQTQSAQVDGHVVSVPAGRYDVVVFNMTPFELSSTIGFRGTESLSTLEVFSQPISTKREPTEVRGSLTQQPEAFAVTIYRDLEVTEAMIEDTWYVKYKHEEPKVHRTFRVTPQLANQRQAVRVHIKGFHNLSENGTFAELSGLAEGFLIDQNIPNSVNARQQLSGWTQTRDEGAYSTGESYIEYVTWGLRAEQEGVAPTGEYAYWVGLIELLFMLVDDKTVKEFDVLLDEMNIEKFTDGIEARIDLEINLGFDEDEEILLPDVEPAEGGSSGFKPNVNPWDEVDVPVVVG